MRPGLTAAQAFITQQVWSACFPQWVRAEAARPADMAGRATAAFAQELELQGLWTWAVFVTMFTPHEVVRTKLVQELVSRHIVECLGEQQEQRRITDVLKHESVRMLIEDLSISPSIVFEAVSLYARFSHDVFLEITCKIYVEDFDSAFNLIFQNVFPVAFRQKDMNSVRESLALFDGKEDLVTLWEAVGRVLKHYLEFVSNSVTQASFLDGKNLLNSIDKWMEFSSLVSTPDLIFMTQEMSWRVLSQMVESLGHLPLVDDEQLEFLYYRIQGLDISQEVKRRLLESLSSFFL